jgi:multiple sugar transport system permease protein
MRSPATARRLRALVPWSFLAPALAIFIWFKFIPMVKGLQMSFYKVNFGAEHEWVGFANFARALADSDLHLAIQHTAIYVLVTVLLSALIAFFLALALEGPARHLRFIRTAMFLPAVTSAAVVAEIWRILMVPTPNGIFNTVIGWIGIEPQGFFADPDRALGSLMLMHIWKAVPNDTVIFVAGLASVNRELYDAAAMDGAGWFDKLWYVTLPGIAHTLTIVLVLGFIRGFRVFTEVQATTGGGPGGSTEVIMTHVYKMGFVQFDYGYASAVSFLLFSFTAITTTLYLVWRKRRAR